MATSVGNVAPPTTAAPPTIVAAGIPPALTSASGTTADSPFGPGSANANANGSSFTAFPTSYAAFGSDGSFGTVGLLGGRLAVVGPDGAASNDITGSAANANAPAGGNAAAAGPAGTAAAGDATTTETSGAQATPGTNDSNATTPGSTTPPADPSKGLIGADPPPIPGSPPDPAPGLQPPNLDPTAQQSPYAPGLQPPNLEPTPGQPASYPPGLQPPNLAQTSSGTDGSSQPSEIAVQQAAQQAAQQQAAQAAANQAQATTNAALGQLHQVNLRLADAYANGNSAAVQQLAPIQVQLTAGTLQGSIWAGLGTTPPQPFAQPEIPPVFLNVSS